MIMAGYRKLFAACHSFAYTDSGRHAKVPVVIKPGPKVGDETIRAVLTSPSFEGGDTIVIVRVGQFVMIVDSTTSKDLGSGAVKVATAMARKL